MYINQTDLKFQRWELYFNGFRVEGVRLPWQIIKLKWRSKSAAAGYVLCRDIEGDSLPHYHLVRFRFESHVSSEVCSGESMLGFQGNREPQSDRLLD